MMHSTQSRAKVGRILALGLLLAALAEKPAYGLREVTTDDIHPDSESGELIFRGLVQLHSARTEAYDRSGRGSGSVLMLYPRMPEQRSR
ncbi:MAG TPA: hypothetical protein VEZ19_14135 [Rubrobacter sp.]|jgi:hypothetical protein|nr:hypothetical protein [Rubrobacter sp.]